MQLVAFFTETGTPKTGLSPTVSVWKVSDNSQVVNAAAMSAIGSGWYKYDFTTYDPNVEYVITFDGTSTLVGNDRYKHATNDSLTQDMQRVLGMVLHNHVEDDVERDSRGNKLSSIIYFYNSAANATTHDKSTGLIGKYNVAVDTENDSMSLLKIIQVT